MPQPCKICTHPKQDQINAELLNGDAPLTVLAEKFEVSHDSLSRHRANHLVKALVPLPKPGELTGNGDLLGQVRELQRKTLDILNQAESKGNPRTMLLAVEQCRRNLELQAKLLGELQTGKTVNILITPEWLQLKGRLMQALERHPEALEAVYEAIEGEED